MSFFVEVVMHITRKTLIAINIALYCMKEMSFGLEIVTYNTRKMSFDVKVVIYGIPGKLSISQITYRCKVIQ